VGAVYRLSIVGSPPRTKKTSNELMLLMRSADIRAWLIGLVRKSAPLTQRDVLNRVKVQPSSNYRQWVRKAVVQWQGERPQMPITEPVHVKALIYRERAVGDVHGFHQAIGDYLEAKGILKNDSLIDNWDGTRRLKDPARPRVEVEITPITGAAKEDAKNVAGVSNHEP